MLCANSIGQSEQFNTEVIAREFTGQLANKVVCVGEPLILNFTMVFTEKDKQVEKPYMAVVTVKELEALSQTALASMTTKPEKVKGRSSYPIRPCASIRRPICLLYLPAVAKGKILKISTCSIN